MFTHKINLLTKKWFSESIYIWYNSLMHAVAAVVFGHISSLIPLLLVPSPVCNVMIRCHQRSLMTYNPQHLPAAVDLWHISVYFCCFFDWMSLWYLLQDLKKPGVWGQSWVRLWRQNAQANSTFLSPLCWRWIPPPHWSVTKLAPNKMLGVVV